MAGDAFAILQQGEPNAVSVIASGPYTKLLGETTQPIVIRNTTRQVAADIEVTATVRLADGSLFAAGDASPSIAPYYVPPGEYAIGAVTFGDIEIPDGATTEFQVSYSTDYSTRSMVDNVIEVVEVASVENRIVGILKNVGNTRSTLVGLTVVCFTGDELTSVERDYPDGPDLGTGDTLPFQVTVDAPCDHFLVAAT